MKYYKLDKEEKQILKDFEQGAFRRVADFFNQKKKLQSIVKPLIDPPLHR